MTKSQSIVLSAMALALSLLSLLLFRGTLSLLSMIFIPATLAVFLARQKISYFLLTGLALQLLTLALFTTQSVFVFLYFMLAFVLRTYRAYASTSASAVKSKPSSTLRLQRLFIILYPVIVSLIIFTGIKLTDLVFMTPLHQVMLRLSRDNTGIYLIILLVEALIISTAHLLLLKLSRRVPLTRYS